MSGADPLDDIDDVVGVLLSYSMIRRDGDTVTLHPLVQAVALGHMPADRRLHVAHQVQNLLARALPGDPTEPKDWRSYADTAPHVQAAAENIATPPIRTEIPATTEVDAFRRCILDVCRYLYASGQHQASRVLAQSTYDRWHATLGPDHPDTLVAAKHLASSLRAFGSVQAALVLAEATLSDHPRTLESANNVAAGFLALDMADNARLLASETHERCRAVLGEDHPVTQTAAANLQSALRAPRHDDEAPP